LARIEAKARSHPARCHDLVLRDRRDEAMVREKSGKRVEDRVEYA